MHTLNASGNNPERRNTQPTKVDPLVPNPLTSDDELLSDLNWQHTCMPQPSESSVKVSSAVANGQNMTYSDTSLPEMNGDAFKIHLKPDAQPYAQAKARKILIPYMDQFRKQLDEMERLRVISSHKEPSTWCHPIVITPKKDSDELRICVD